MKQNLNIVWLKRDLRLQDHLPLLTAENSSEQYLIIYIFEPSLISGEDCSDRHLQFIYHSIDQLNQQLDKYNRKIHIFHAEALQVFEFLSQNFNLKNVFSHEESGVLKTWERDKFVATFLESNNIEWIQSQKDGILRGLKNRKSWDKKWHQYINEPVVSNSYSIQKPVDLESKFELSQEFQKRLRLYPEEFQKAGEDYAWRYLKSFCEDRGKNYNKYISKPLESRKSCARISPYLAWGNLSIKQAYHFVKKHPNYTAHSRAFEGMLTRLIWHDHFIQKFETDCSYENLCINKGYESLEFSNNPAYLEAWKKGNTGLPLVDACMRCLIKTGWINFRMRAMVVSVLCHHLDCDWRLGMYHLAKLFLDYEPGIHYSQFQMQAGTTGVNIIRIYNPVKQSQDHDPNGIFIKQWIPELAAVPIEFIHEPWKMTALDKVFLGLDFAYPDPIIDLEKSGKYAREKIWGHRENLLVQKENKRILKIHVRNNAVRKG